MHRKSKKVPLLFIIVFVAAVALAFATGYVFPIPGKWRSFSVSLLIPVYTFLGIFVLVKIGKKRR